MDKEDVVYIYNGILLSHKNEQIMSFTKTWMNLEIIILSEVSQRKTNIIWYHSYLESNFFKMKQTYRYQKQTYGYQRGNGAEGVNQKHGINIHTTINSINSQHEHTVLHKQQIFKRMMVHCTKMFSSSYISLISSVQSLSHIQLFVTLWIAAHQASLSITNSQSSLKLTCIESVMPSSHLILCRFLLLLPPIPPSIRVFSNESTLHMRWPKYWSFSFSIIPSTEIPGLISFGMDWLDLLAVHYV